MNTQTYSSSGASGAAPLRQKVSFSTNIPTAVQLEFDRSLYLDAALREPVAALGDIAALLARLVSAGLAAIESPLQIAAE